MHSFTTLIITLFTLFPIIGFAESCESHLRIKKDAFVYASEKNGSIKVIYGMKIEDPKNKIIIIYNYGG